MAAIEARKKKSTSQKLTTSTTALKNKSPQKLLNNKLDNGHGPDSK